MGRKLTNKLNVDNTDADYPNGRIKDDTGSNNGTPVDEDVYGDLHQTEERSREEARTYEADVTMDELPDSVLNDYQFYQARRKTQSVAELYKNGKFTEVFPNLGAVDFIYDCFVWQGELFVSDQGSNNVEVFSLFDGTALRTIGAATLTGAQQIQIIYSGAADGDYIYVQDDGAGDIKVYNIKTGGRINASEINTTIVNPISFQIDQANNRIYVLEAGNRVETFNLATAAHIPGESFGITAGGLDIALTPYRDRLYILYTAQTRAFTIPGVAVVAEDVTLTGGAAAFFHVVAEKMYVIENAPTEVFVYDIRRIAALPLEDVLNVLTGNILNLHIRNGVLYLCDQDSNDVLPIKSVNVQEYV